MGIKIIKVAVIQAGSVLFDALGSVNKAVKLINKASKNGASLVILPEAFIPGYPRGLGFGTVIGKRDQWGRELWRRYYDNSISVKGKEVQVLKDLAKKNKLYIAVGISEKEDSINKSLYCTLLYIGPNGEILGKHRKIKPTASERYIWGEGNNQLFPVVKTPFGQVGGLICWENYMPLARMALFKKGLDIYIAPTADCRESWQNSLQHIALEGRCFVLGCNQYITADSYPKDILKIEKNPSKTSLECSGGSVIISPLGEIISGPLFGREGILYADLNQDLITEARFDFDVNGHYQRPDLFKYEVNPEAEDTGQ